MPNRKQLVSAAVFSAALAGGGVAGAILGAPGTSFAQEDDGSSTTVAEDDTTTTADDSTDTTADDSAADDDANAEDDADASDCGPGGMGRHGGPGLDVAAEAIGISVEDLRAVLEDGGSIASVAEANDVDVQTVIDALVADANEHIDQAVADGKLTEDEAAERKADVGERIAEMVEREGLPARGPGGPGRHGPPPEMPAEDDAGS